MKTLTILLTMILAFNVNAGSLEIMTDDGNFIYSDCSLNAHAHSDVFDISEFYLICDETPQPISMNINTDMTLISVNLTTIIICPLYYSEFIPNLGFSIILDCRLTEIFSNGFENRL